MLVLSALLFFFVAASAQDFSGWPTYGGGEGGQRFSAAALVNKGNVAHLHPVWTYHTHALDGDRVGIHSAAFESTPILFHGLLYLTTPFDKVIALDPASGAERWTYTPDLGTRYEGEIITSRGVASWDGGGTNPTVLCSARILVATLAGHLEEMDAATGKACTDFGSNGVVDLKAGLDPADRGFTLTSAPTVVGDVVVVGSSIGDNGMVAAPHGTVRAYDVRSGRQVWTWDPLPWSDQRTPHTGAGNAWSTMAADSATGLVFLPTGSASPDYYGGLRPGDGKDADSVVALDAKTGRKVWAYQVVHHNLWDYDIPSEPLLFTWHGIPAVAIATKMGMIFVLDRRTGQPLVPVEERPVPQSDVPGEQASATQPFSALPNLMPQPFQLDQVGADRDRDNADYCRSQIKPLRYDGMYTPPSLRGSLIYPGAIGGINWGSAAYNPTTGILYANVNRLPYAAQLIPRAQIKKIRGHFYRTKIALCLLFLGAPLLWLLRRRTGTALLSLAIMAAAAAGVYYLQKIYVQPGPSLADATNGAFGEDHSPQSGAPYGLYRHPILDHRGMPCTPGVWGTVSALNLQTGKTEWEQPHGTLVPGKVTGSTSLGGVIVTGGGLLFTAATKERVFRAYDAASGAVLWQAPLPVPAQATPMTYVVGKRQFVVLADGGSALFRTATGDSVIAYSVD